MKKKLLILGGIIVVLIFALGLSVLLKDRGEQENGMCYDFIVAIEANDGTGTYNMLSNRTKSELSEKDWSKQVASLAPLYSDKLPELSSQQTGVDPVSKQTATYATYKIKSGSGPYRATCAILPDNGENRVDSFSSEPDL